jgi:hypothetical protein
VKPPASQRPVRIGAHAAYFSYRWLAWALAALALTLPGHPVATLPRDAGILLLAGVMNVVATALAYGYVRVARVRPTLLALDLVGGVAILWLSGSTVLPFLPYALSGLILPGLLFAWRGGLLGGGVFLVLDMIGLSILNPALGATLSGADLATRGFTPLVFASLWIIASRAITPLDQLTPEPTRTNAASPPASANFGQPGPGQTPRNLLISEPTRQEPVQPALNQFSSPLPLVLTRAAEQRADPARRLLYEVTPTQGGSFTATLEQLGVALAGQSDLTVLVKANGAPQPLSLAQQTILLRTAQEALLNIQHHARATTALLTLSYTPDAVALLIQDDGVGLLDGTYERPGMHALRALRYRVAELDGEFAVFEGESCGLSVRATLPYEGIGEGTG